MKRRSSTRIPIARPESGPRTCSEAGDLVVVGWTDRTGGSPRLHVQTSIMALVIGGEPELAAILTVRDPNARALPIISVVCDGALVTKSPLTSVPIGHGLGRVFRGSVLLPRTLIDGQTHDVVVSVTARRAPEADTVPDLAAAAAEPVCIQTLRFYAKRFGRAATLVHSA